MSTVYTLNSAIEQEQRTYAQLQREQEQHQTRYNDLERRLVSARVEERHRHKHSHKRHTSVVVLHPTLARTRDEIRASLAQFPGRLQATSTRIETLRQQLTAAQQREAQAARPPAPLNPGASLQEVSRYWSNLYAQQERVPAPDYSALMALDGDQRNLVSQFMQRLTNTYDFRRDEWRPELIRSAHRFLHGACTHPAFRDTFLAIIHEAIISCVDRITYGRTQAEVAWRLCCQQEQLSDEECARLLIGLHRLDRLEAIVRQTVAELYLPDPIEAALYFRLQLRDTLDLPISGRGMIFAHHVPPGRIEQAASAILDQTDSPRQRVEILVDVPLWIQRLTARHHERIEQINASYHQESEAAGDGDGGEVDVAAIDAVGRRRERLIELTEDVLHISQEPHARRQRVA